MSQTTILEQAAKSLKERASLNNDQTVLEWVNTLPNLTETLLNKWNLTPHGSADNGALSSCIFATDSLGSELILKIPSNPNTGNREYSLMSIWGEQGISPETISHDSSSGAILMERITPGAPAEPYLQRKPVETITDALQAIHSTPTGLDLPKAETFINQRLLWAYERYENSEEYTHILNFASSIAFELLTTQTSAVSLHGDLQPKNILTTEEADKVKIIDPFGLEGEPEIDYALWATVQASNKSIEETLQSLCSQNTNLIPERLKKWALYYSILELRPHAKQYVERIRHHLDQSKPFSRLPNSSQFISQT